MLALAMLEWWLMHGFGYRKLTTKTCWTNATISPSPTTSHGPPPLDNGHCHRGNHRRNYDNRLNPYNPDDHAGKCPVNDRMSLETGLVSAWGWMGELMLVDSVTGCTVCYWMDGADTEYTQLTAPVALIVLSHIQTLTSEDIFTSEICVESASSWQRWLRE